MKGEISDLDEPLPFKEAEPKLIKNFPAFGFSVVAQPSSYSVGYNVYEHAAVSEDSTPHFFHVDVLPNMATTTDTDYARVYLHGRVRWDGCSNWHFDEQDRVMLHACDRKELVCLGEIMAACWDWTEELCAKWVA